MSTTFNDTLTESLAFTDAGANNTTQAETFTEHLAFTDAGVGYIPFQFTITENLAFTDTGAGQAIFSMTETESLAFTDSGAIFKLIVDTLTENLVFTDPLGSQSELAASVTDTVVLAVATVNDENTYIGWIVNNDTTAHSIWDHFSYNALATDSRTGVMYGSDGGGIYAFDSTSDAGAPINASLLFGKLDFGVEMHKRIPEIALGMASSGSFFVRVTQDDGTQYTYRAVPKKDFLKTHIVNPGKGIRSRYLQFELVNDAGQDFALETVEFFPVMLTKHR